MSKLAQFIFEQIYPLIEQSFNVILEGGNVFPETTSIKKEYVLPTLKPFKTEMDRYFPTLLKNYRTLGSVGKKDLSGDIDLAIDSKNVFNDDGTPKLNELGIKENEFDVVYQKYKSRARTAQDGQLKLRTILYFIAKKINGSSKTLVVNDKATGTGAIFCKFPQYDESGNVTPEFVQVDLNFGNLDWLTFSYYSDVYKDNVKGLHRTQLVLSMFAERGYIFSHNYGVKEKDTNTIVANNPDEAVAVLNKAYGFSIDKNILSNYFKLQEFLQKNLDANTYKQIIDRYIKILDSTRADIPTELQDYWIKNKERLDLHGNFLPDTSNLIKYKKLEESGSIGANRIPRSAVEATFKSYIEKVLKKFPGFKGAKITGSYNTTVKPDHGDLDLVINIEGDELDKKKLKKMFADFINSLPDDTSVPFTSGRHIGKKSAGTGDIVIVQFPMEGLSGQFVQIDNMIVTSETESGYRKSFLDLPAEKQGLLIGLAKAILLEEPEARVFQRLGITNVPTLEKGQEYEFNLSNKGLTLRLVTLGDNFKELNRKEVWNSFNWNDTRKLFQNFNIDGSFDELLNDIKSKLKNPRSKNRIKGVFKSMVVINAGEAGTPKGINKQNAIKTVDSL